MVKCSICSKEKKEKEIIYKDINRDLFICNEHPELLFEINWKLNKEGEISAK